MSNKKLLKGAFILAFAGLTAKFLGIFFKIPLQRLIGDEGMGLFGLPYPLYTVMLSISITGFPAAVSKLISEKLANEDIGGANRIFRVSLAMLISIGLFSSAFLFFGAHYIIELLDWPRDSYYSIVGLSMAPLFVSIMSAFRGYFQGMQLMVPTAISQIVEQIGRVVIGVGLSYYTISMGIGYAAGAASFGASAGSILGVTITYFIGYKLGMPLIERYGKWLSINPSSLDKTRSYYEKYGDKLLLIGFFIPGVRQLIGYFTGIIRVPYPYLALYAYTGVGLWVIGFFSIGFIFGEQWQQVLLMIEGYLKYTFWALGFVLLCFFIIKWFTKEKDVR